MKNHKNHKNINKKILKWINALEMSLQQWSNVYYFFKESSEYRKWTQWAFAWLVQVQ